MLDDISDQLSILHNCPEHLRNRLLSKDSILFSFHRETDIDRTALGCYDLCAQACLGQENLARIGGIYLDSRGGTRHL